MSHSKSRRARRRIACEPHFTKTQVEVARGLCREGASAPDALSLERWTSSLLGRVWQRRRFGQDDESVDPMLFHGAPLLEGFAELGGDEAVPILAAIERLDRGPLGALARKLRNPISGPSPPQWIDQVGTTRIARAFAVRVPGDGEALLLEADDTCETPHMIGAFISEIRGGIATQLSAIRVIDPMDPSSHEGNDDGQMKFRPVDPVLACRRLHIAINRTDGVPVSSIEDLFVNHRALAIARVTAHEALL